MDHLRLEGGRRGGKEGGMHSRLSNVHAKGEQRRQPLGACF